MSIIIRVDDNADGFLDSSALELALSFCKVVGPDHAPIRADSYGLTVGIDEEGVCELLRIVGEELSR